MTERDATAAARLAAAAERCLMPLGVVPLSDGEFALFRELTARETGVALGPGKRSLVQARLGRRLRALGLATFREYHDYLMQHDEGQAELMRFVGAITTHKTSFFREPHHFAYLAGPWASQLVAARGRARRLRLWSVGCSTGEEAYTLAMVLSEAGLVPPRWDTEILAADIDPTVLAHAAEGRYTRQQIGTIPPDLFRRYWRDEGETAQARPELRALVRLGQFNLATPWDVRGAFDVIVCRNVIIYFDRLMQDRVLERLLSALVADGLLILGHAESVIGRIDSVYSVGPTIYARKPGLPGASGEAFGR